MKKLIILLTFGFFSCGHEPKTIPAVPAEINPSPAQTKNAPVDDPYFVETQETISTYGPHSITRNMLQDKKGNLWFASWQGIIRYDGKLFTNLTLKEGLKRFHVFSVLEDRTGNLWFGTIGGGVYRYDGRSFTYFTTKEGLVNNLVLCMLADKDGITWFGTDGGVSRYDGKTFTNFTMQEGLNNNSVNSIVQDKTGNLWFGTRGGVSCYDGNSFTDFKNKENISFYNVRSIIEDKTGSIWIGSQDGLWRYDPAPGALTNFRKNFIGYIFEDKTGNIWLSEGDGKGMTLNRYDPSAALRAGGKSFTTITTKFYNQVFGICEDNNGHIWFGTEKGVCRYDGKDFTDYLENASKQ